MACAYRGLRGTSGCQFLWVWGSQVLLLLGLEAFVPSVMHTLGTDPD